MSSSRLCECNVDEINFLLEIKYEVIKQNTKIKNFLESRSLESQRPGTINHNQQHVMILYTALNSIVNNNKCSLYNIDIELPNICKHQIVEDYIERGVDEEMIKIKYCCICEMTF